MDKEFDQRLNRLVSQAKIPSLHTLDGLVLDRLKVERAGKTRALRLDVLSFAGALVFGLTSAVTFAEPTTASTPSSLAGYTSLAPSTLLERSR